MASPFPNFEVGDTVDVSLPGGGFLNNWIITYVPIIQNMFSDTYWELEDPETGDHIIVNVFLTMRKKV